MMSSPCSTENDLQCQCLIYISHYPFIINAAVPKYHKNADKFNRVQRGHQVSVVIFPSIDKIIFY